MIADVDDALPRILRLNSPTGFRWLIGRFIDGFIRRFIDGFIDGIRPRIVLISTRNVVDGDLRRSCDEVIGAPAPARSSGMKDNAPIPLRIRPILILKSDRYASFWGPSSSTGCGGFARRDWARRDRRLAGSCSLSGSAAALRRRRAAADTAPCDPFPPEVAPSSKAMNVALHLEQRIFVGRTRQQYAAWSPLGCGSRLASVVSSAENEFAGYGSV